MCWGGGGGGRLLQFGLQWEHVYSGKWILDIVSKGYHIEFTSPPPLLGGGKVTQIPSHQDQRVVLESEIDQLLLKRAIVRVSDQVGPLYLSFFLAPKKPNSWRPILNLRPLNSAHIRPKHFRMENLAVILPFLSKQMWAASLDLQDAYLHIPIAEDNQQYLAFRYKGQSYKFRSLPFGLSTAPRVFTMVTRVVIAHLRRQGITLFAYLDDWLILGNSPELASAAVNRTVRLLQSLGWLINEGKSHLTPTTSIQFLGACLDFNQGRITPSQERIKSLRLVVLQLASAPSHPASTWMRALGMMASMVDIVPLCRLRMRPLQFHLLTYFKPSSGDLKVKIFLSKAVLPHFLWWSDSY
ncbi:reverse transcriptase domain-containing protein [Salmonella sp. s51944]|uniref:reverse transcriptase domain-containing protein n=1 Tax=Salmonella sp. s51944 TaxID=3159655 RepID=UPI00397FDFB0